MSGSNDPVGDGLIGGEASNARPDPCVLVIFGASGDLTRRKLIPALFALYQGGLMPERFAVVGTSRTALSDEDFRARVTSGTGGPAWDAFAAHLHYQALSYDDPGDYRALGERLDRVAADHGIGGNRLFNLALPPGLYATVAAGLAGAGLSREDRGWVRLVVEKPFGRDLASSRALGQAIAAGFGEHQVFRIDHYMAKETVQNILVFRCANAIFEPLWNRRYVDHVRIHAGESLGVGHRAGYYDSAGVLRDMFQNHMMQLLALVAAEPPARLDGERIRDEKVKLFRSLRPFDAADRFRDLVLGQYAAGEVDDVRRRGYLEADGVAPGSLTPTYAALRVFVDSWRWQGVPFYLVSGKRLARKETRIDLQFKAVPHTLFRETLGLDIPANRLTLSVYPEEAIRLRIRAKQPGDRTAVRRVDLHFDYAEGALTRKVDAYEKSLLDAMRGDATLFWRQDGLDEAWAFFDPVIEACATCSDPDAHLHPYPAGSEGPDRTFEKFPALRAYLPGAESQRGVPR